MESGERLAPPSSGSAVLPPASAPTPTPAPAASSSSPSSSSSPVSSSSSSLPSSTAKSSLTHTATATLGSLFGGGAEQMFGGSSIAGAFPLLGHPAFGLLAPGSARPEFGGLGALGVTAALAAHPQLGAFTEWWRATEAVHGHTPAAFFPPTFLGLPQLFAAPPLQNHHEASSPYQTRTPSTKSSKATKGSRAAKGVNGAVNGSVVSTSSSTSASTPSKGAASSTQASALGAPPDRVPKTPGSKHHRSHKSGAKDGSAAPELLVKSQGGQKPKEKKQRRKAGTGSAVSDSESGSSDSDLDGVSSDDLDDLGEEDEDDDEDDDDQSKDSDESDEEKERQKKKAKLLSSTSGPKKEKSKPSKGLDASSLLYHHHLLLMQQQQQQAVHPSPPQLAPSSKPAHTSVIQATGLAASAKPLALVAHPRGRNRDRDRDRDGGSPKRPSSPSSALSPSSGSAASSTSSSKPRRVSSSSSPQHLPLSLCSSPKPTSVPSPPRPLVLSSSPKPPALSPSPNTTSTSSTRVKATATVMPAAPPLLKAPPLSLHLPLPALDATASRKLLEASLAHLTQFRLKQSFLSQAQEQQAFPLPLKRQSGSSKSRRSSAHSSSSSPSSSSSSSSLIPPKLTAEGTTTSSRTKPPPDLSALLLPPGLLGLHPPNGVIQHPPAQDAPLALTTKPRAPSLQPSQGALATAAAYAPSSTATSADTSLPVNLSTGSGRTKPPPASLSSSASAGAASTPTTQAEGGRTRAPRKSKSPKALAAWKAAGAQNHLAQSLVDLFQQGELSSPGSLPTPGSIAVPAASTTAISTTTTTTTAMAGKESTKDSEDDDEDDDDEDDDLGDEEEDDEEDDEDDSLSESDSNSEGDVNGSEKKLKRKKNCTSSTSSSSATTTATATTASAFLNSSIANALLPSLAALEAGKSDGGAAPLKLSAKEHAQLAAAVVANHALLSAAAAAAAAADCSPLNLSQPTGLVTPSIVSSAAGLTYHSPPSYSFALGSTPPGSAKRKRPISEEELRSPLEMGWQRETRIKMAAGRLQGDVAYYAPCGKRLRQYPDVVKYLSRNGIADITRDNFSFSAKIRVGDFYEARDGPQGLQWCLLKEEEVIPRLLAMEGRRGRPPNSERQQRASGSASAAAAAAVGDDSAAASAGSAGSGGSGGGLSGSSRRSSGSRRRKGRPPNVGESDFPSVTEAKLLRKLEAQEIARQAAQMKLMRKLEKQALARAAKEARKQQAIMAAEERRKQKEQIKILKQQEKIKRIQQIRMEKELRAQHILEAKRKKREEAANAKILEAEKRIKEKEMRRQQAIILKHQEMERHRLDMEMERHRLDMERERRRQHVLLLKAVEARKKAEDRERLRQEKLDERRRHHERKLELQRLQLEIAREMRMPKEDMCLSDHKPMPELSRIPGLVLPGEVFSDCLMVVQFLRAFGRVLGMEVGEAPTLGVLQEGLLNLGNSMGRVQDLLVRLLSAAITDPGLPPGHKSKTILGESLSSVGLNRDNVSEVLQMYLEAHSWQAGPELTQLASSLRTKAFQAHTPGQKASILAYLANELACSKSVVSEIDKSLDHMTVMRRDELAMEVKLKKLRVIHAKRTGRREMMLMLEEPQLIGTPTPGSKRKRTGGAGSEDEEEEEEESDEGGEEEEEEEEEEVKKVMRVQACDEDETDQVTSVEELEKQIERLAKQQNLIRRKLFEAQHSLRSMVYGSDRYRRRYWVLPQCGGVYVEAIESGEGAEELAKERELLRSYQALHIKEEAPEEEDEEEEEEEEEDQLPTQDTQQKMEQEKGEMLPRSTEPVEVKQEEEEEEEEEMGEEDTASPEEPMEEEEQEKNEEVKEEDKPAVEGEEKAKSPGSPKEAQKGNEKKEKPTSEEPAAPRATSVLVPTPPSSCSPPAAKPEHPADGNQQPSDATPKQADDVGSPPGRLVLPNGCPLSLSTLVTAPSPPDASPIQQLPPLSSTSPGLVAAPLVSCPGGSLLVPAIPPVLPAGSGVVVVGGAQASQQPLLAGDQLMRALTEKGSHWFSLLPRQPCDDCSLVTPVPGAPRTISSLESSSSALALGATNITTSSALGLSAINNNSSSTLGLSGMATTPNSSSVLGHSGISNKSSSALGLSGISINSSSALGLIGMATTATSSSAASISNAAAPSASASVSSSSSTAGGGGAAAIVCSHVPKSTSSPSSCSPNPHSTAAGASPLHSHSTPTVNSYSLPPIQVKPSMAYSICGWAVGGGNGSLSTPHHLPHCSSPLPHYPSGDGGCASPLLPPSVCTSKSCSPCPHAGDRGLGACSPLPVLELLERPKDHPTPLPIPEDKMLGWWKVCDMEELRMAMACMHSRGIRERSLQKQLQKNMELIAQTCNKNKEVAVMEVSVMDEEGQVSEEAVQTWCVEEQAMETDIALLVQVEALEKRVTAASLQVKGWTFPEPQSEREDLVYYEHKSPSAGGTATSEGSRGNNNNSNGNSDRSSNERSSSSSSSTGLQRHLDNPLDIAVTRLGVLESHIERRYLQSPLGSTVQIRLDNVGTVTVPAGPALSTGARGEGEEEVSAGLRQWRKALSEVRSSSQLAMCLQQLQKSIAWERSIMKVYCQMCRKGDNEDLLLLCDGCDKGCHTYCHKPKIFTIPEGDWYCPACITKASTPSPSSKSKKAPAKPPTPAKKSTKGGKKQQQQQQQPPPPAPDPPPAPATNTSTSTTTTTTTTATTKQEASASANGTTGATEAKASAGAGGASSTTTASSSAGPSTPPKKGAKESKKNASPAASDKEKEKKESPAAVVKRAKTARDNNRDLGLCRVLLAELERHQDAWPFLSPVNLKSVPGYRKVIKKPMDFSTIREKLVSSLYQNLETFIIDVNLVFDNCEKFNEDNSDIGRAGHNMRKFFEKRWTELLKQTN